MPAPFEIVAGAVEIFIAPVGESMPAITLEPPAGNWVKLGTRGDENISEDGVTVTFSETRESFRGLGSTGKMKQWITEEDIIVSLQLADMTLEEWARFLNGATVTTSSDDRTIPFYKGNEVNYFALLVRGNDMSAYVVTRNFQMEFPRIAPLGDGEVVYVKGAPAMLDLKFDVMVDLSASSDSTRFGIKRTQFQN